MQFTHEAMITVEASPRDVWADWTDAVCLPKNLSHVRATAQDGAEDLARLVILLDGRHLEFAVERTMCAGDTVCWQSLGDLFLYVLTVALAPAPGGGTQLTVTVAYDPPGFLPDIAQTLGRGKLFKHALESDLRRYADSVRHAGIALAFAN